jgi:phospholipase D1/2
MHLSVCEFPLFLYQRLTCVETLIARMEQKSGVRFHEAQVALARQWIGDMEGRPGQWVPTEVDIRIPEETNGALTAKKEDVKTEKIKIPPNQEEARRTIERFEAAAKDGELEAAFGVSDNVVQHMLHDVTGLHEETWQGTPEEELQS